MLANSRKLKVEFNYEFLEDFQDEQPSSGEDGETNIDTRYISRAHILLSSLAYIKI